MNARDTRILGALDTPRTAREIADLLHQEDLDAWAERHGVEIEWGGDSDAEPLARLLAVMEARDAGVRAGLTYEIRPRLRSLERRGLVERIQVEGRRPMLWRRREPA